MATTSDKIKEKPDSLVSFQAKRISDVELGARTKFGELLVNVSVNRTEKCFDVIVKDANESDITSFESLWPMCKVEALKSLPRKK